MIPLIDPWTPPQTRLLDPPESDARAHVRLLAWSGVAVLFLGVLAGFMFWLTGAFDQVFRYMARTLPPATALAVDGRAAWFGLPALVLMLTLAAWRNRAAALRHRRVIGWGLSALAVLAVLMAWTAWWALQIPFDMAGGAA